MMEQFEPDYDCPWNKADNAATVFVFMFYVYYCFFYGGSDSPLGTLISVVIVFFLININAGLHILNSKQSFFLTVSIWLLFWVLVFDSGVLFSLISLVFLTFISFVFAFVVEGLKR
jgi:hypothetical protein